jgi:hypothetical protein
VLLERNKKTARVILRSLLLLHRGRGIKKGTRSERAWPKVASFRSMLHRQRRGKRKAVLSRIDRTRFLMFPKRPYSVRQDCMNASIFSFSNFHKSPNLTAGNFGDRFPEAWSRTQPGLTPSHSATSDTSKRRFIKLLVNVDLGHIGTPLSGFGGPFPAQRLPPRQSHCRDAHKR